MEVQSARPTKNTQSAKPKAKMSKEQIEEMVKAKFGDNRLDIMLCVLQPTS